MLATAGCGGSSGGSREVAGDGFHFPAPVGWHVARTAQKVTATPEPGAADLVSVSVFQLERDYRPELWPRVVPELDRVAARLAAELGGRAGPGATFAVAARRARRYDVTFSRGGAHLTTRVAFVLDGRREYQLLCQWTEPPGGRIKDACAALLADFRLA